MPALLHHQPGCFIPATQLFHQSLLLDITALPQLVTSIRILAKKNYQAPEPRCTRVGEHSSKWSLPQRCSSVLEEEVTGQGGDTHEPRWESSRRNVSRKSLKSFGREE